MQRDPGTDGRAHPRGIGIHGDRAPHTTVDRTGLGLKRVRAGRHGDHRSDQCAEP